MSICVVILGIIPCCQVCCDHSRFTVQVDVKHFNPEELMVKVTGDFVEVQGKHKEKKVSNYCVTCIMQELFSVHNHTAIVWWQTLNIAWLLCSLFLLQTTTDQTDWKPGHLLAWKRAFLTDCVHNNVCFQDGSGLVTRQFNRRYRIPEGVDSMALESAVSPEGILIISAPMLQRENSTHLSHSEPWAYTP